MSSVSYNLTNNSVTVYYAGSPKTFAAGDPTYDKVVDLIRAGNLQGIPVLLDSFARSIKSKYPQFEVVDGAVKVGDDYLPSLLGERLRKFADEGFDYKYLLKFWERLRQNPSNASLDALFSCLERNHHPILPDGRFMAWKGVTKGFKDTRTGKFDNAVGQTVKMNRNQVDDNNVNTCSHGLHVASYEFAAAWARSHGGVLIEIAVDPANAVAVPHDSNFQKMRVSEYTVLGIAKDFRGEQVVIDYDDDNYDADWDDDDCEDWEEDEVEAVEIVSNLQAVPTPSFTDKQFLSAKAKQQKRDSRGHFIK